MKIIDLPDHIHLLYINAQEKIRLQTELTEPKLPEGELDLIFIISAYHHFADPVALLRNARPSLKPTGIVAIGEWLPKDNGGSEYRTPVKIEEELKEAGYTLERIEKFLEKNNMYLYIFRPAE